MAPVFEITSLDPTSKMLVVRIDGVDLCLVNALRRVIIASLPNVGFRFDASYHGPDQAIRIEQNDSPLHNEYMMHRISMVPLHLTLKEIEEWDPDRYEFLIDKKASDKDAATEVTTKDIRVLEKSTGKDQSALRDRMFPPCPITKDHIILTKLRDGGGKAFRCRMSAEVNTASTNASFGMVSMCTFANVVDHNAAEKARKQIRESEDEPAEIERRLKQFETLEVQRKYATNKYKEACLFDFKLHSECAVSAPEILGKGVRVLIDSLKALLEDEEIETQQLSERLFVVTMHGVSHTEGNVIQALLFNHLVRGDEIPFEDARPSSRLREYGLSYIGYTVPHPLEGRVLLKFTGKNIESLERARSFFQDGVAHVASYIEAAISEEWIKTYANYKK